MIVTNQLWQSLQEQCLFLGHDSINIESCLSLQSYSTHKRFVFVPFLSVYFTKVMNIASHLTMCIRDLHALRCPRGALWSFVPQLPAAITPCRDSCSTPMWLATRCIWQCLWQSNMNFSIVQITIMSQELCQSIHITYVIVSGTTKVGPSDIIHAKLQHTFGSNFALQSQQEFWRDSSMLSQDTDGFV